MKSSQLINEENMQILAATRTSPKPPEKQEKYICALGQNNQLFTSLN